MPTKPVNDYSRLDNDAITQMLFHPRANLEESQTDNTIRQFLIPVADGVVIGGKLFLANKTAPIVLFFHGNGEIVSDYDDLAPYFMQFSINFIAVDYRGYGNSNGTPSASSMMQDCHTIYTFVRTFLQENAFNGHMLVMGRSLGSASALEIALHYHDAIAGLIIESGFAFTMPLLNVLGVPTERLGLREQDGFGNADKIKHITKPTLIIHAENDHLIPYKDGQFFFANSPAAYKKLLTIPRADHNTIFLYGMQEYLQAIRDLIKAL